MSHPAREELFAYVHGWDSRPDHLDGCRSCLETAGRLREELDLVRRAEARILPKTGTRRLGSFVPLGAAAAVLAGVAVLTFLRAPDQSGGRTAQEQKVAAVEELARIYLDGSEDEAERARAALLARGPAAVFELAAARRRRPDAKRIEGLAALIFEIKRNAAGEGGKKAYELLEKARVSIDLENAPLSACLDYLKEVTGLNLVTDPQANAEASVSIRLNDVPFKTLLDLLCERAELDYDSRYGVLFLSATERLWKAPKAEAARALTAAESKELRSHVARLSSDSFEEREAASGEIRKFGASALPVLEESARSGDSEVAARCRGLVVALRPRLRYAALPRAASWRSQKLEEASRDAARKLETMKIDLAFENTALSDIVKFIRDFSGLNIASEGEMDDPPVTFKIKDLPLGQVLDILFLPRGRDIRLEQGIVTVFKTPAR